MQALFDWLLGAGREAAVFIVSMVPLIELRGAIPLGMAAGMTAGQVYPIAVIGNLIPIPFLILFAERLLDWLETCKPFAKFAAWYKEKLYSKKEKVTKYARFGLFLFVALPIPGTGAWSGAAIAALLKLPVKKAFLSIALGIMTAGLIMVLGMRGLLGLGNVF